MSKKVAQKCSGNIKPRTNDKKRRDWSITAWIEPSFDELQMRYLVYGTEECPETGKIHYQTYVYFHNAKTFSSVLKYFKSGENRIEQSKGNAIENIAYCTKDNKFKEFGERPKQGKRTDLEDIAKDISNGTKVDEIALNKPTLYHQYGRTLNKLEDLAMRNKYRTQMTKGIWIHGGTGTGKSHIAFQNYNPLTHYNLINDNGWWDGYTQQKIVIINDFRGWIPYDTLLQLTDKWPMSVKRRNREPIPFTSEKIIITSSLKPQEVYNKREENDHIEQLLRRYVIIDMDKYKNIKDCIDFEFFC